MSKNLKMLDSSSLSCCELLQVRDVITQFEIVKKLKAAKITVKDNVSESRKNTSIENINSIEN